MRGISDSAQRVVLSSLSVSAVDLTEFKAPPRDESSSALENLTIIGVDHRYIYRGGGAFKRDGSQAVTNGKNTLTTGMYRVYPDGSIRIYTYSGADLSLTKFTGKFYRGIRMVGEFRGGDPVGATSFEKLGIELPEGFVPLKGASITAPESLGAPEAPTEPISPSSEAPAAPAPSKGNTLTMMQKLLAIKADKYQGKGGKEAMYVAALLGSGLRMEQTPRRLAEYLKGFLKGREISRGSDGRISWIEDERGSHKGHTTVKTFEEIQKEVGTPVSMQIPVQYTLAWGDPEEG